MIKQLKNPERSPKSKNYRRGLIFTFMFSLKCYNRIADRNQVAPGSLSGFLVDFEKILFFQNII